MSKLVDFAVNAPETIRRAPSYLVEPAEPAKGHTYWPAGNSHSVPATCPIPFASSLAGQSLSGQILAAFTNYYRFIGQVPARKSLDRQVKQMCVYYQDLRKLGFDIKDVTTFGLRHATALLAKWQAAQCAPNTVYARWSGLRTWSRVLGKHGMLAKFQDMQPGFDRRPEPEGRNRVLDSYQLASRSDYLKTKPDLTVYLIDRLCRELDLTREEALQVELNEVKTVIEGGATILRVGMGANQRNVPVAQHNRQLFGEIRDFMVGRNRKVLAWSNLDLDAALQKYDLRLSYVGRKLFGKEKTTGHSTIKEGGAK